RQVKLSDPEFRILLRLHSVGEADRQPHCIDFGERRVKIEHVAAPGRAAETAIRAGILEVLPIGLDLLVDRFLHVAKWIAPFVLEEFGAEKQLILLDAQAILRQTANGEPEPSALLRLEVLHLK